MSCGPGRGVGPQELWASFDVAVERLNRAGAGDSLADLVAAYAAVAEAAGGAGRRTRGGRRVASRALGAVGGASPFPQNGMSSSVVTGWGARGRGDVVVGRRLGAGEELDGVGDDLDGLALGVVLARPFAPVQAAVDRDRAALGEEAGAVLAVGAPDGDV